MRVRDDEVVLGREAAALLNAFAGLPHDLDSRGGHALLHARPESRLGGRRAGLRGLGDTFEDLRERAAADQSAQRLKMVRGRRGVRVDDTRASVDDRACSAGQPGRSANHGSRKNQKLARTPAAPSTLPTLRSTIRIGPIGRTRWIRIPAISPSAWPTNAPPKMTTTATTRRVVWSGFSIAATAVGTRRLPR